MCVCVFDVGEEEAFEYEIYSSHSGLMFGNGQQITLQAFTMATGELSRPGP